jgi:hypothetical protein
MYLLLAAAVVVVVGMSVAAVAAAQSYFDRTITLKILEHFL